MGATNRFRGKWDVSYYRQAIRKATAVDLPALREAQAAERALLRPRKRLVTSLQRAITMLEKEEGGLR